MTVDRITIVGLSQFRRDLRAAESTGPRRLTEGLKVAGAPIVAQTRATAARRTGRLAAGYSARVRGIKGDIVSSVPYAGGAEWGQRGKWSGFMRYGSPPRFAGAAVESKSGEVMVILERELKDIVSAFGWFR